MKGKLENMNKNMGRFSTIAIYVLLILGVIIVGFPLLYAITGSFKSTVEFLTGGSNLLPKEWIWQNYTSAWKIAKFEIYTYNSIAYSVLATIGTIITTSLAGYVLSRSNFPGKKILLGCFAATLFISGAMTLFPIFKICRDLKLLNSVWGLIIAEIAVAQPFCCLIVMSYINGISKEIDEAAKIDGCNFFRIFTDIILPVIKPIIATVFILEFRRVWNDYMMPLAFTLSKPNLRPLTVGVVMMKDQGEGISAWNLMIAGTVISLVPILVVYLFMNKYFIAGLTEGSVKG